MKIDPRGIVLLAVVAAAGPALAQRADDSSGDAAALGTLRAARDSLLGAADLVGALDPATQIVEALKETENAVLGRDLLTLASIQAGLEDFETAEINYLEAIDRIQDEEGPGSPALIAAHQALGRSYINTRRFGEAIAVIESAQEISRRNEGLFNVDQSALLDDLTYAHLGLGDTVTAWQLQQERLDNAVRTYGAEDARTIAFHVQLGDYYDRSRLRDSAREQYRQALLVSEVNFGSDDPGNLPILRRLMGFALTLSDESDARDRLAAILERRNDIDPLERSLSLAALGDWELAHDQIDAAHLRYEQAFAALTGAAGRADDYFAQPRMIDFVQPIDDVDRNSRSKRWAWGTLVLEFDVTAAGRADNVETVSMQPEDSDVEDAFDRRIRETRFRPRLRDGEAVATSAVRYTHNFRFYVDD